MMKPVIYNPLRDPDIYEPEMARWIMRVEEEAAEPESNIELDKVTDTYPENNYPDYFRKAFEVASQKAKKLDETISMVFKRLAFDVDPQMDAVDAVIAIAIARQDYGRYWSDGKDKTIQDSEFNEITPGALRHYVEGHPDIDYRLLGSAIRFAKVMQFCLLNPNSQSMKKTVYNVFEDAEIYDQEGRNAVADILSKTWAGMDKFDRVIKEIAQTPDHALPPSGINVSMRRPRFSIQLPF